MSDAQRYFFVHMQKTAGTSLYFRLAHHFGRSAVYPTPADETYPLVRSDVDHMVSEFAARSDELMVIAGHFPLCVTEMIELPLATFTVLREPVERTLSYLRHRKKVDPDMADRSLEEIYTDVGTYFSFIDNHMVKMLSITPDEMVHGFQTLVAFDDDRLERAKRNLEGIEVVGLQERFEDFCDELEATFGWDLGDVGVTNSTAPVEVSDEFRAQIASHNRFDVELYRHAELLRKERPAGFAAS